MESRTISAITEIYTYYGRFAICDKEFFIAAMKQLHCNEQDVHLLSLSIEENIPERILNKTHAKDDYLVKISKELAKKLSIDAATASSIVTAWCTILNLPVANVNIDGPLDYEKEDIEHTIEVASDGSGDYTTISAAISAAIPNSTILVKEGIYRENIVIPNRISIVGEGGMRRVMLEDDVASKPCVVFNTDNCSLKSISIIKNTSIDNAPAISISGGKAIIENCEVVSRESTAISVRNFATAPLILKCAIHDSACGMLFDKTASGTIEKCVIFDNNKTGVLLSERADPTFKETEIHHSLIGVSLLSRCEGVFIDCKIFDNATIGTFLDDSREVSFSGCLIRGGKGTSVAAIRGAAATFSRCKITGKYEHCIYSLSDSLIFDNCDIEHKSEALT